VRAIGGFTRILADEYAAQMDAEGKRICGVIGENTRKMEHLIDDLLAFSRLSRVEMRHTAVNMNQMANETFLDLLPADQRKNIRFRVADIPDAIGDHAMLVQVWSNLLSNAIKFSAHRAVPTITVTCRETSHELIYCIEDNGTGFDMKYIDKLFEVFQRLHSVKEYEGTGVGLAIVQRIIHRHGGRVWAEGFPDKGARFYFSMKKENPETEPVTPGER
jgi:light-regulated signal transduction histidine kinase (bacteriophytochrome)